MFKMNEWFSCLSFSSVFHPFVLLNMFCKEDYFILLNRDSIESDIAIYVTGNLCESDCSSDADCADFHCNKALGYFCKCEASLCAYKKKATECKTISDCISQGKCSASTPCACTQDYCTLPWWVQSGDQEQNCRKDQDCEETIAECAGNACSCQNKKPVNDYEMRGTCGKRNKSKRNKRPLNKNKDAVVFQ